MIPSAKLLNMPDNGLKLAGSMVVILGGKHYSLSSDDTRWEAAISLYRTGSNGEESAWEQLLELLQPVFAISKWISEFEDVTVDETGVYYKGNYLENTLTERILEHVRQGINPMSMINFLAKLMSNPSSRAIRELYSFLAHKNLPITENGNFLAYKSVRDNYLDWHSNTYLNTVGKHLSMPRKKVDKNKNHTCSDGFHAGTLEYATQFNISTSQRIMIVEINPKHVVSIPADHQAQKLRTNKYFVVDEMEKDVFAPLTESVYPSRVPVDYDEDDEDYEDDEDDPLDDQTSI